MLSEDQWHKLTCVDCGGAVHVMDGEVYGQNPNCLCRTEEVDMSEELARYGDQQEVFYRFNQYYIPQRMAWGIESYIERGVIPGDFLQAVICNDLKNAVGYADDENIQNLPAYVGYFYNNAPIGCWGSKNAMKIWAKSKIECPDCKKEGA